MKKIISILCALMLAGSTLSLTAAAEDFSPESLSEPNFEQMAPLSDSEITPYYLAIHSIFVNISNSGRTVYASADCNFLSGYTTKMTVNLQKSSNGSSWLKTLGFGTASSSDGEVSLNDSATVSSGYYYRVQATITVYDGNTVIESVTKYSSSVYIG